METDSNQLIVLFQIWCLIGFMAFPPILGLIMIEEYYDWESDSFTLWTLVKTIIILPGLLINFVILLVVCPIILPISIMKMVTLFRC